MAKQIISAIDVGTTKVATIVANVKAEDDIEVLGVGVVPCRGLHKGIVVNMDEARQSIAASVKEAQRISGIRIDSAYVGVTGRHISSLNNGWLLSRETIDWCVLMTLNGCYLRLVISPSLREKGCSMLFLALTP
jgi:cell division ATPase FtsA